MTTLDLDAIEARLAAATPGPWRAYTKERHDSLFGLPDDTAYSWVTVSHDDEIIGELFDDATGHRGSLDAAFIAAAPTDIAALIAEVRRLRAEALVE